MILISDARQIAQNKEQRAGKAKRAQYGQSVMNCKGFTDPIEPRIPVIYRGSRDSKIGKRERWEEHSRNDKRKHQQRD